MLLFPVPRVDRTRYLPNKVVGLTKDRSFQSVSVSPSHAYLYNMNKIVLQLLFITLVNFQNFMGAKELKMSLEIFNKMVYFTSIGHLIIIDVQFTRFSG